VVGIVVALVIRPVVPFRSIAGFVSPTRASGWFKLTPAAIVPLWPPGEESVATVPLVSPSRQ